MSLEIVESVRVKYPTPLAATHGAFLIELARTLGGGAGLLAKDWGTFVRLPDGRGVAQDIICYLNVADDTATHFDCLGDGEGAATPTWHEIGPIDPARYVAVTDLPDNPQPIPPTVPDTPQPIPVPCKAVEASAEVLDALHEMRMEQARVNEIVIQALARLENDNRKPRAFTGSARFIGAMTGEVGGVEG